MDDAGEVAGPRPGGIEPPVAAWHPHFQARPLTAYNPVLRGAFAYPGPFDRV